MKITVNGDPVEVKGPLTLAQLLETFEIDPRLVAVEHNLAIIKRRAFDATVVDEGDSVEIVKAVGGG